MNVKKVPLRRCVACQATMPKKELIRVVKTPQAEVCIDLTGKKSGRGAYLCAKHSCFVRAHKIHVLERALKCKIKTDTYEQLMQQFVIHEAKG